MLHQVHTVTGPFKSYGSYPDPLVAKHIADHYSDVLHVPLVVAPVEEPCRSLPPSRRPFFASKGGIAASYAPGHHFAEMQLVIRGRRTECTAQDARDLFAVLVAVFGAAATETPASPGR